MTCFEFLANSSLAHTVVGNQVLSRCGERTLHLHQYKLSEVSLGIAVAQRKKINASIKKPTIFSIQGTNHVHTFYSVFLNLLDGFLL